MNEDYKDPGGWPDAQTFKTLPGRGAALDDDAPIRASVTRRKGAVDCSVILSLHPDLARYSGLIEGIKYTVEQAATQANMFLKIRADKKGERAVLVSKFSKGADPRVMLRIGKVPGLAAEARKIIPRFSIEDDKYLLVSLDRMPSARVRAVTPPPLSRPAGAYNPASTIASEMKTMRGAS
ncbi:MAG: hypothetical protein COB49_02105 [Alphaproteobacteria bacterium]|nr:MAG: hypothetical protein COB49_02105 [Alphaproteobacteria bacterium]